MPAPTIKRYRLKDSLVELIGLNGVRVTETIIVDGLTPNSDDKILYDAMFTAGVPSYAQQHNYFTTAFVQQIKVKGISDTQAEIQVVYESPQVKVKLHEKGKFLFKDGTTLEMTTTQKDANNGNLVVSYDRRVNGAIKWTKKLVGNAQILVPRRTIQATAIVDTRPSSDMRQCVGKVNGLQWQNEPQRTWLCAGVESDTQDLEQTWKVTATFIHNDDTWDAYLTWVDENGQIPADIDAVNTDPGVNDNISANGILRAIIYKQADFFAIFGG